MRLERARVDAEFDFIAPVPEVLITTSGDDFTILGWPAAQRPYEFVITMAKATVEILCDVAVADHWPTEALRVEVTTRLEQLIAEAYADKHAQYITLAAFNADIHRMIREQPWWVQYLTTLREYSKRLAELPAWAIQLQQLRVESGLTVETLAEAIESDRSNVGDHLWGRVKPNAKTRRIYEQRFKEKLGRDVKLDV
jgi:hypothetical protein